MASQPSLHSASDYEDSIHSLKHVSQQLKSLELWRQQEAIYKVKDQLERDGQIALLEEQIKALKKRDEKIKNKLKSRSNSSKGSRSGVMSSNFCPHLIFKFGDLIEFFVLKDWFN